MIPRFRTLRWPFAIVLAAGLFGILTSCLPNLIPSKTSAKSEKVEEDQKENARLSLFVGIDISGSFRKSGYFDDSIKFLAHYIKAHLEGYGEFDIPKALFVGSIGGSKYDESKTFFPIQTFEGKTVEQIERQIHALFPSTKKDQFTDFNAFIRQVETFVKNKNLLLRPISVVLLSDGRPSVPKKQRDDEYRKLDLSPLENLARSVTLRLLYTDPVTAEGWQTRIKRDRVRIWTQDAVVMKSWKAPTIYHKGLPLSKQDKFFSWVKDNVDFPARLQKVE